jgi:hypothetical protein
MKRIEKEEEEKGFGSVYRLSGTDCERKSKQQKKKVSVVARWNDGLWLCVCMYIIRDVEKYGRKIETRIHSFFFDE